MLILTCIPINVNNIQGGPQKCPYFSLAINNFYKNKEIFKIFPPPLLEVYRILLVETTLKSLMFYYTFSVINTMFIPCTTQLYDSTAATRTLKLSTTLLCISSGIRLISLLMLCVDYFHKLCLSGTPSENSQAG